MPRYKLNKDKSADDFARLFTPEMENGGWLNSKRNELMSKKKRSILGDDSEGFKNINDLLSDINGILDMPMKGNGVDNETMIKMAQNAYFTLIDLCDNYLIGKDGEKKSPRTTAGKERVRIVEEIKLFADKDIKSLMVQNFQNEDLKGITLRNAIGKARTRTVTLDNSNEPRKYVGGAASRLLVLNENENKGNVGFFSNMKVMEKGKTMEDAKQFIDTAIKQTSVSKESIIEILNIIDRSGYKNVCDVCNFVLHPQMRDEYVYDDSNKFADEIYTILKAAMGTDENIFDEYKVNVTSGKANMNARNVATSRVAKMLNSSLIAKSEMVNLQKQGSTELISGSVMDKAEGIEGATLLKRHAKAIITDSSVERDDIHKELKETVKDLITGSFQKEMADLQVMDYLCGQIDRHSANYFIKTDKSGNFIGLQGIDNDLSFGDAKQQKNSYVIGNHGRAVVNDNEELTIPHMSRGLAMNIQIMNEDMVRFALHDLIEEPEIEAFCERLKKLKIAIGKELVKDPKNSKLRMDDEWNEDTLNDFLGADSDSLYNNKHDETSNYLDNMIELFTFAGISEAEKELEELKEELEKMKKNK
ncbi:MAG: hypothetical protein IJA34_13880 [Lachnospiraceae bacterium]|nr:hypothetical protein [Lachnospiraceae bacterium]